MLDRKHIARIAPVLAILVGCALAGDALAAGTPPDRSPDTSVAGSSGPEVLDAGDRDNDALEGSEAAEAAEAAEAPEAPEAPEIAEGAGGPEAPEAGGRDR